jgi:DNA-binding IclR family transcriptional regulator
MKAVSIVKSRSADAPSDRGAVYHPERWSVLTAGEELSGMPKLDGFVRNATSDWWADMLARRTGELVWIGELVADRVHIVHQVTRPEDLVLDLGTDSAIPWYACALGQALVAGLDHAAREALLAIPASRLTGMTVTDPVQLRQLLAMARDRGYAVEANGATLGDAGIAAPVFDSARRVVAAVGIVGPAERLLSAQHQQDLVHAVCVTAQALSEEAGAGSPKDS